MLVLKYNICVINGCTQIRFTETTGRYITSNLTGYGTPNIEIADVNTAELTIVNPSGTTYNIDLFATTLFPSSDTQLYYDIPLSDIGDPDTIADGQWYFTYTITTDTETYTKSMYKYFTCNTECCVNTMLSDVDTCDCCKTNTSTQNYLKAWTFLQSLKNAAKCGDSENFTNIKKIVDKLCLNSNCKTCK